MFTEKDIKPIPKYILKLIKNAEKEAKHRFYSYFTKLKGKIVKITVAIKHKNKSLYFKQIIVRALEDNKCYIKDITTKPLAGIIVGWFEQGFSKEQEWFEDNEWNLLNQDINLASHAPIVNVKWIMKFKEYKYSLVDKCPSYYDVFNYLRVYRQYPHAELFIKFGLTEFATSKRLLSKTYKDKKFRLWLIKNSQEIKSHSYYVSSLLLAYKHNKTLKETQETQEFELFKRSFFREYNYLDIKDFLKEGESNTFLEYIRKQSIDLNSSLSLYRDYIKACKFLKLDMNLPQNRYSHDLEKWHDIRIDEYASAKALADEKELKKFYIS